jgi:hypothetical protein
MRIQKTIIISALAVAVVAMFSLTSVQALDLDKWEDTWHKVNFKVKGVCEKQGVLKLKTNSASAPGFIHLLSRGGDSISAVVAINLGDGDGWRSQNADFDLIRGEAANANDVVLKTRETLSFGGVEGPITLFFYFRLTGKEKNAAFSSGKIAGVSGYAEYPLFDDDYDCSASLTVSGSKVDVNKVPPELR